jgi:hypothetical protein
VHLAGASYCLTVSKRQPSVSVGGAHSSLRTRVALQQSCATNLVGSFANDIMPSSETHVNHYGYVYNQILRDDGFARVIFGRPTGAPPGNASQARRDDFSRAGDAS